MKKYKNNFGKITLILVLLLGFLAGTVFAKSGHETIKVLYNNIKLVVNGQKVNFGKDSTGKTIEPFIYNGTTYLPVRAAGEALGKEVNWDGKSQTVFIGDSNNTNNSSVKEEPKKSDDSSIYIPDVLNHYGTTSPKVYRSTDTDKLEVLGKKYEAGYVQLVNHTTIHVDLNGKYKTLNFKLAPYEDKSAYSSDFTIRLDGRKYISYNISANSTLEDITVDVTGVNKLTDLSTLFWTNYYRT